jgi:hypothetical protein
MGAGAAVSPTWCSQRVERVPLVYLVLFAGHLLQFWQERAE